MTTADSLAAQADAAYADAKTLTTEALNATTVALDEARSAAGGISVIAVSGDINPTDVNPIAITKPILPTNDFSTEVKQAFDYAFGSFNDVLQPQILNYISTFFPDISDTLKTDSDQWLIDTIANGRYVPTSVETALWNRAKDREVLEAARTEQEIIDASASRGFSAPPGVVNYTLAATQEEVAKKLTTINRDMAIKAFDVANENTKFAIQQAVALRTAFVSALGEFIRVAMVQPNNAVAYAKTILEAKTGLYDSAIRLYSAQIDEERLRTGVLLENNNQDLHGTEILFGNFYKAAENNVNKAKIQASVAVSAADQLARVAAAAMATRNSIVSVSAGV